MTHPLHVAVIFEYPSLNGGENSWLATLPAIRKSGIELVAIAPAHGPLRDRLSDEGISVLDWQTIVDGNRVPQNQLRETLSAILKQIQPRLVHANSLSMSRLLGPVTGALGIPSIGHIRDIVRLSKKAVSDVNQIDRLLAVSNATRDWHIAQGLEAGRVVVQYNGVDLERFAPQPEQGRGMLQKELGIAPTSRLIGNVGQLGLRKGTEKVLESALLIADDFPDVHWVLAGERHSEKEEAIAFETELHKLASKTSIKGRVHFVGRVTDMPSWYADLEILVHAARQEPLGRVLLEACAMGLPIVATDAGGTREVLGDTGCIVPIDDTQAIATALHRLLSDPYEKNADSDLGLAGSDLDDCAAPRARKRAIEVFDARVRGRELTKHYQSVAAEA